MEHSPGSALSFLHSWPFWKVQHFHSKYCSRLVVDLSFQRRLVTAGETNGNLQTPKAPALVPRFWPAFTLSAAEEPGKMLSIPSSQGPISLNLVRLDSRGTLAKSIFLHVRGAKIWETRNGIENRQIFGLCSNTAWVCVREPVISNSGRWDGSFGTISCTQDRRCRRHEGDGTSGGMGGLSKRPSHSVIPIRDLAVAGGCDGRAMELLALRRVTKAASGKQMVLVSLL